MGEIVDNSIDREGKNIEVFTVWYNREHHVDRSIDSLIQQTSSDFSIFAVDDGSDDETFDRLVEKAEDAADEGVPMRVWGKENQGFTTSLKRAIEEYSDSKIIALHGAGDISKPDRLNEQYKLLTEDEEVVATGVNSELISPNGKVIKKNTKNVSDHIDINKRQVPRPGTHGEAMYYRDIYNLIGGYRKPFKYAQDTDLWLRMYKHGDFRKSSQILYQQLRSEETVGGSNYETKLEQIWCSAAAFESARSREQKKEDPIENLPGVDMGKIEEIAKKGGLHNRAIHRIRVQLAESLLEGNIHGVLFLFQSLDRHGKIVVLKTLPEKALKFPDYAAKKYNRA